MFTSIHKITKN